MKLFKERILFTLGAILAIVLFCAIFAGFIYLLGLIIKGFMLLGVTGDMFANIVNGFLWVALVGVGIFILVGVFKFYIYEPFIKKETNEKEDAE